MRLNLFIVLMTVLTGIASASEPVKQIDNAQVHGVSAYVTGVDAIEHTFHLKGQRRQFVAVFSTTYALHGRRVTPSEFWEHFNVGDYVSLKVKTYPLFHVATTTNMNIDN